MTGCSDGAAGGRAELCAQREEMETEWHLHCPWNRWPSQRSCSGDGDVPGARCAFSECVTLMANAIVFFPCVSLSSLESKAITACSRIHKIP